MRYPPLIALVLSGLLGMIFPCGVVAAPAPESIADKLLGISLPGQKEYELFRLGADGKGYRLYTLLGTEGIPGFITPRP
ncbi:MAG: hypothetical protein JWM32_2536 [Verrucomicrobia bacterium]|nr:hypothetical protein [Verrucomicrobiota bacterium]